MSQDLHPHYHSPSPLELTLKNELIGQKITIFWDGDNVYYPAVIVNYNPEDDTFSVLYENDETKEIYKENLRTANWKIWKGSNEEYQSVLKVIFIFYFFQTVF